MRLYTVQIAWLTDTGGKYVETHKFETGSIENVYRIAIARGWPFGPIPPYCVQITRITVLVGKVTSL